MGDTTMRCEVGGQTLTAIGEPEICRIFRDIFAERLADRQAELSVAVEVRTPYLAHVAVSGADGRTVLERELSVSDASLNGQVFEAMANSLATELSGGFQQTD